MAAQDDIKAAAQRLGGQAKEAVGKLTGDDKLAAEGKVDQAKGVVTGMVGDVKDAVKKATGK